jgi:methionyl-tRNA synthetase
MPRWIPVPGDEDHVMYVWCDALTNYITWTGFWINDEWEKEWPADIHVIWKDILRFHAAFWPAMLLSAKLPLPKTLLAHGHLTLNWAKMSKSTWNVLDSEVVVDKYWRDPFVFDLLYNVSLNADGDFTMERLNWVYNSMLIWAWGNLVNRVVSLCKKYEITEWKANEEFAKDFEKLFNWIENRYLKPFDIQWYLQEWYRLVQKANEYITKAEPRKKRKDESTKADAINDLQILLYVIKNLSILSAPILTQGFEKIKNILWIEELKSIDTSKNQDVEIIKKAFDLKEFRVNLTPEILYQRLEG